MNTLTAFFDWLLTASLRASVLTLGVCLVQIVLQKHLSPRWRYALWLPVLVVLLIPVLPESRWSVVSVFEWKAQVVETPSLPVIMDAAPSLVPVGMPLPAAKPSVVDWSQVRLMVWAAGAILVLLFGAVSFTRAMIRIRRTRQSMSNQLAVSLDEATREVGLRQRPRVLVSPRIQSPAVTGLLCPVLLLPPGFDRDFTAEEKRLILHHELMHLKRGDLPLNTLLCVLMALHWFNPLLWLAFFKVRADREAACDAQVLDNATPQRRNAYGHALLKIESTFAPLRLSLGFIGILQRHASLRARIRSIAAPTRTRPFTGSLATLCIFGMTFLGITRAATEDKNAPEIHLTARFIEISGKANEADGANKVLAEALAALPASPKDQGQLQIVLDDPQQQLFLRHLSSKKGVDLMSTPSVITRSSQKASIEVSREFVPPGKPPLEKKVGVMLDLLPTLTKVDEILLTLNPRIVEFEGFKKNARGEDEPVFNERKADARLNMKPGQTVLLDVGSRTDTQDVEDIVNGITTQRTDRFTRRAIVLVTARLAGKAVKEKSTKHGHLPSSATIDSDNASFDEELGISRHTGNARLVAFIPEGSRITATAEEIVHHARDHFVIVKAPLELIIDSKSVTCEDKHGEAEIDLKTGRLKLRGATFRTVLLLNPPPGKSPAEAQATILRAAQAQKYDFRKANLGDVLRFIATDAGLKFISLPEDHPASNKLVTFSLEDSPFSVLETLCKAHDLMLVLDGTAWNIRPLDDPELIGRSYPLLNETVKSAEILDALQKVAKAPATVKFDENNETFHIHATRLQHSWVDAYFQGLHGKQ